LVLRFRLVGRLRVDLQELQSSHLEVHHLFLLGGLLRKLTRQKLGLTFPLVGFFMNIAALDSKLFSSSVSFINRLFAWSASSITMSYEFCAQRVKHWV
jgi:hypothetical protein